MIHKFGDYFRLKLSPTSGRCPWWLIFFKNLFYQKNCKEAVNIGEGQIRGALFFNFFVVKKCPFLHLPDAALSFYNNSWSDKNSSCLQRKISELELAFNIKATFCNLFLFKLQFSFTMWSSLSFEFRSSRKKYFTLLANFICRM